ncbi:helix-turn-helix transcriptional regulator [Mammaliicoccus sp. D-M17]|uniref:helix-turn-helix domain-containing protein n=1 Tax=Mammaliicoccus sp. D-M17 TaxID=2898677 RepID=UPI001EFB9F6F|nr:helix-turn-helix transcriptional regulator [Mammaliicoccus sp. D-M17]
MDEKTVLTLRQWRALRGYSQRKLSEMTGVTERTIINYEKDVVNLHNAKYSTVEKLAVALDIKVANIFLGSDSEKPNYINK